MKCIRCGEEFQATTCLNTYCSICKVEHKKEYLAEYHARKREGKPPKMNESKCVICGKTYKPRRYDAKYCGKECYKVGVSEMQKRKREERKLEKKSGKKPNYVKIKPAISQLSMIQREAEKLNMTYGQYVAMYGNK